MIVDFVSLEFKGDTLIVNTLLSMVFSIEMLLSFISSYKFVKNDSSVTLPKGPSSVGLMIDVR